MPLFLVMVLDPPAGEVFPVTRLAKAPVQKNDAAVVVLVPDAASNRLVKRPACQSPLMSPEMLVFLLRPQSAYNLL